MSFINSVFNTGGNAVTVNAPANMIDGDKLTLYFAFNSGGGSGTITPPSGGFTEIFNGTVNFTGSGTPRTALIIIYQKIASSEPASYTLTTQYAAAGHGISFAHRGRAAGNSTPIFTDFVADLSGIASVNVGLTGYTASLGDDVIVIPSVSCATASALVDGTGWGAPAGYTERHDPSASAWYSLSAHTRDNLSAGATGTLTSTLDIPTANDVAPFGIVIPIAAASANNEPVLDTPEADITQPSNTAFTVDVSDNFSDADVGDTLTFTMTPAVAGLSITSPGVITGTTALLAMVPTDFTVTADDGNGGTVDDVISIHITGILNIDTDNSVDPSQTDVQINCTGLPSTTPTTFTVATIGGEQLDNLRWNSGNPLVDIPAGITVGSGKDLVITYTV